MITKLHSFETKLALYYHSSLPVLTENYESAKILTNGNKKRLLIKNFLLFICLINNFTTQSSLKNNAIKIKTFVLSNKTKIFTQLRAPFRHKLTKKHVYLKRYKLGLVLYIKALDFLKKSDSLPVYELQRLVKFFKPLETNTLTTHRVKVERAFLIKKIALNITTTAV